MPMMHAETAAENADGKRRRRTGTDGKVVSAFLELTNRMPFDSVTVTDVCREAGISRSTFYNRYGTTEELLKKTLDLMMDATESTGKNLGVVRWDDFKDGEPMCLYIRRHPEFHGIFYDPSLRDRIVGHIMCRYSQQNWDVMEEYGDMDRSGYEAVQAFQLYGCISMMAAHRDSDDREWSKVRDAIDNMVRLHLREHVI